MNGSYSVPTGSSRSPLIACDRPRAESMVNRFISAMPSSKCCPCGEKRQWKVDGMRSVRNTSAISSRANSPRRFTHPPRLVDTVTSGDVVTMRPASAVSPFAKSCISWPKPCWVDSSVPAGTGRTSGTGTAGASKRRGPWALNGTAARNASNRSGGVASPSKRSHSWPLRIFSAARSVSTWPGFISPAWLSLCPASGRPNPLIV